METHKLILIIFYYLLRGILCSKFIQIAYESDYIGNTVGVKVGKNRYSVPIDLTNQISHIIPLGPEMYDIKTFAYDSEEFIRKLTDLFFFEGQKDHIIQEYHYTIPKTQPNPHSTFVGYLSFCYSFTNIHHSIIHQFKQMGIIDSLQFSFEYKIQNTNRSLYLGEIPPELIQNKTHSYCDVIGRAYYWDCFISEVKVTNDTNEILYSMIDSDMSNYAYFDTINKYVYAPKTFMDKLFDTYYKNGIDNGNCLLVNNNDSKRQLLCYTNYRYQSGDISFVIGNYSYKKFFSSFWRCDDWMCLLNIIDNPHGNYWIFGTHFFDEYDMVFNYDDKKIHIYSSARVKLHDCPRNIKNVLFLVLIILLFNGIGYLSFMKYTLVYQQPY